MKTHDLGWGNAYAVRTAFLECIAQKSVLFNLNNKNLDYTNHSGNTELNEITKTVIKRQTGIEYKHVLLVNGATGGCTIAMRAYAQMGYEFAITREPPYFPIYPNMIGASGLKQSFNNVKNSVVLLDSPENPGGNIHTVWGINQPLIHDAVYHSKVYARCRLPVIACDVVVGSYSKLLGLNGLRTGWMGTNNDLLHLRLKDLVVSEYAGLSSASDAVLLDLLRDKDEYFWAIFEAKASYALDCNREEWSKLEKYFHGVTVGPNGMFYYAPIDLKCKDLLERSGITWTKGSSLGTNDSFGRFNIGHDRKTIREAVKTVLKNDRIT